MSKETVYYNIFNMNKPKKDTQTKISLNYAQESSTSSTSSTTVTVSETRDSCTVDVEDLNVHINVQNAINSNSAISDLGTLLSGPVQPKLSVSIYLPKK